MNLHYYFFGLNQERLSIYLTANPRTVEDRNTDTGIQEKKKKKEAKKDDLKKGQNQSGRLLHRIRTGGPRRRNPISGALRRFLGQPAAAAAATPHKGTGEPEGARKKRRRIRHAPLSSGDLKRCRRAVANRGEEKRGDDGWMQFIGT